MAAYVIVDVTVKNPEAYEEYKKLAPPSIAAYGGKYVARGGRTEVLEGEWSPRRLVILEFESVERAREWVNCPEYATARKLRQASADTNMVVIEGLG